MDAYERGFKDASFITAEREARIAELEAKLAERDAAPTLKVVP